MKTENKEKMNADWRSKNLCNGKDKKLFVNQNETPKVVNNEQFEEDCPKCGSEAVGIAYGTNECFDCGHEWQSD